MEASLCNGWVLKDIELYKKREEGKSRESNKLQPLGTERKVIENGNDCRRGKLSNCFCFDFGYLFLQVEDKI